MNVKEYLKDVFTSWFLIGLMVLETLICLVVFGGILWLSGKPFMGVIVGSCVAVVTIVLQIIGRYYHLKEKE